MLDKIVKLLSPPSFPDREKNRTARILHTILFATVPITFLSLAANIIASQVTLSFILPLIGQLIAFIFNKKGYVRITTVSLLSLSSIVILLSAWFSDGIHDSGLIYLATIVFVAGSLLGTRAIVIFGITNVVGVALIYLGELTGFIVKLPDDHLISTLR